jgi:uncharacterized protein (AIM24 family)
MKKNKQIEGLHLNVLKSVDRIYNSSSILGTPGNHYLKIELFDDNDFVITQLGSLICMNSGIEKADIHFDGILNGFQKIFAGEPLFYQLYSGKKNKSGYLYLGSNFLNSIIVIKIKKGNIFRLSRNSFLASTGNIKISFTFKFKGIFEIGQEEGFILPTAECVIGDYGYIWLCAYGNLERINIPINDYIIIDNGVFLACNNKYEYTISKLGKTLFSSFFGGEGFGMKFIGVDNDTHIYIQTKNINDFLVKETTIENTANNGELLDNAVNAINFFTDNN